MPLFSTRRHPHTHSTSSSSRRRERYYHRRDPDHVAAGYKAALANPNTTSAGRKLAKHELRAMGRSTHVPFMTKVKRTFGIRSTPRRKREQEKYYEREHRHRRRY
ncbi:hypothetical protein EV361DRAFT_546765 [Lentinula raphanica]|uniref:Uncharacterized protein n=1 Tax=Lentinula raphanica TaxID=153919 RepID=A0AA38PE36_9AGAR|nr:hypothetical protein F5880DRAFT_1610217 [Lentinula raphanica]KAJ3841222.1 hypothetical protein F5878DRAFT_26598 [Lentinula raphanica]KAJ3966747.1 hypothetical protein EV361DRAFT_546765 [Lentinula raphanica]